MLDASPEARREFEAQARLHNGSPEVLETPLVGEGLRLEGMGASAGVDLRLEAARCALSLEKEQVAPGEGERGEC